MATRRGPQNDDTVRTAPPERPVVGKGGGKRRKPVEKPEEMSTQLWSPVASSLFGDELKVQRSARREGSRGEAPLVVESDPLASRRRGPDTQREIRVARHVLQRHRGASQLDSEPEGPSGHTADGPGAGQVPPRQSDGQAAAVAGEIAHDDPRQGMPDLPMGTVDRPAEVTPAAEESDPMVISGEINLLRPDTLETTAQGLLEAINSGEIRLEDSAEHQRAEAEAYRLLNRSVAVMGEEADASVELAEKMRAEAEADPNRTIEVVPRRDQPLLRGECRMCGRRITAPEKRRLRGTIAGHSGFECEVCHNHFCAAHVVRVSSLWRSLLWGARFRCQLCQHDVHISDK